MGRIAVSKRKMNHRTHQRVKLINASKYQLLTPKNSGWKGENTVPLLETDILYISLMDAQ
jgi:hypothetical protein